MVHSIMDRPMNVLIVEDSPAVRAVLSMSLKMADFQVEEIFEACNGREGLTVMREKPVDLVFTDLNMPEMRGDEMIDRMNEDSDLRDIPIIVVSYEDSNRPDDVLKEKGIEVVLPKPFTPHMLSKVVDLVMKRNGRLAAV